MAAACLHCLRSIRTPLVARANAMAYAVGIGGATGGLIETTFPEETETLRRTSCAFRRGQRAGAVGYQTFGRCGLYQPEVATLNACTS